MPKANFMKIISEIHLQNRIEYIGFVHCFPFLTVSLEVHSDMSNEP